MFLYKDALIREGIAKTRAGEIACGVQKLHTAICQLDDKNLKRFLVKSIDERLRDFAAVEELRDVMEKKDALKESM